MTGRSRTTFRCTGARAKFTLNDSENIKVEPAAIEGPHEDIQGIVVFSRGVPRYTITLEGAVELYNQLDQVLTELGA